MIDAADALAELCSLIFADEEGAMFCPHCGALQADDARFCEKCGGCLAPGAEVPAYEDEFAQAGGFIPSGRSSESGKRRVGTAKLVAAVSGAVVLLAAAIATGYGFATGAFSGKGAEPTQVEQVAGPSQGSATNVASEVEKSDDAPDVPDSSSKDGLDSQGSLVRYRNARFGFFMDIPAEASVTESDNGAGMTCVDETGSFHITTWASNTVATTLSQSFAKAKKGHDVAYEYEDDECYVVSYKENGSVFYIKEYVGSGSLCGVRFEYPESESDGGDKLVERLAKTFTPGDLTSVH